MKKTEYRFKLLRIRQKISLMAFINHMTINELFMNTILKSYEDRYRNGLKKPLNDNYIGDMKENELMN